VGALTLTFPSSLSWAATLTGTGQSLADTTPGGQQYTVDDATGPGAGWHVQVSATTFTNGSSTPPNNGTFATNGIRFVGGWSKDPMSTWTWGPPPSPRA
jgi:hypothetical protein